MSKAKQKAVEAEANDIVKIAAAARFLSGGNTIWLLLNAAAMECVHEGCELDEMIQVLTEATATFRDAAAFVSAGDGRC